MKRLAAAFTAVAIATLATAFVIQVWRALDPLCARGYTADDGQCAWE
jgi:hypothetical protein